MSVKERLFNFLYVSRNHYTYEEAERQLGWNKDSCRNNFFWMRYILSRDPSLESELRWFTNEEVDEIGALMLDFDPDLADILFIADGSKDPFHHIRYDKRKEQFHCNQKVRTMVYRSSSSSVIEYTRCVLCVLCVRCILCVRCVRCVQCIRCIRGVWCVWCVWCVR